MKLIFACILLSPLTCFAQTYKCQVNGKWEYQSYPCTNAPSKAVDTRPSTEGMTGLRDDARSMALQEREQAVRQREIAAEKKAVQAERRQNRPVQTNCYSNSGYTTCTTR